MQLLPYVLIVFHRKNLERAFNYCQQHPEKHRWTVLCAFEAVDEIIAPPGISCINLLAHHSYQRRHVSPRVTDVIHAFFRDTHLNGVSLNHAVMIEGVPVLRAKDNEVLQYTLLRMVFLMDYLLQELDRHPEAKIHLLIDSDSKISIPEWPNIDRWLDIDAFYGPIFSRIGRSHGREIQFLSLISSRAHWMHRLREFSLISWRFFMLVKRGISWREKRLPPPAEQRSLAIWVRSKSQVREVESLVSRWLAQGKVMPFFIQDDSFKKTDCRDYLRAQTALPFVCTHHFLSFKILFQAAIHYFAFRFLGVRRLVYAPSATERNDAIDQVILSPEFRKALAVSLSEAILASSVTIYEIKKCHQQHPFQSMLVMSNYDLWGHIAGYLGQSQGFHTISLQNFLTDPYFLPTPYSLYDAHVVFDHQEQARVIQGGAPPDRVHALGSVLYSAIRNPQAQKLKSIEIRKQLSVAPDKRVILLGTQSASANSVAENERGLSLLFDVVNQHPMTLGFVKIHPYEKLTDYKDWIEKARREKIPVLFFDKVNIDDLLVASDIYISRFSTTMILSTMLRKPTLSFVNESERGLAQEAVDFIQHKVIPMMSDHSEASAFLDELLDEEKYAQQVERQESALKNSFSTYDEQGIDRIQAFVEKFIFQKPATPTTSQPKSLVVSSSQLEHHK